MRSAFTIIELIAVIIIVGILTTAAVPRMISFYEEAQEAAEQQVVGRVLVGINTYFIESVMTGRGHMYPETLDDALIGSHPSESNQFFDKVLEEPAVSSGNWYKLGEKSYRSPIGNRYIYVDSTGNFQKQ